jgi:hypothetical protein
MRKKILAFFGYASLLAALSIPASAAAQLSPEQRAGRFELGAQIGGVFGTPDDTAFGLVGHGDYFFSQNFSIGPMLQLGWTSDYFQIGPSVQFKYTYDIDTRWKANAQAGLGFMFADLDARKDKDDTGILIPLGAGIDYRLTNNLALGATLLFNFTDLDKVRNENFNISLLGGVKFRF